MSSSRKVLIHLLPHCFSLTESISNNSKHQKRNTKQLSDVMDGVALYWSLMSLVKASGDVRMATPSHWSQFSSVVFYYTEEGEGFKLLCSLSKWSKLKLVTNFWKSFPPSPEKKSPHNFFYAGAATAITFLFIHGIFSKILEN